MTMDCIAKGGFGIQVDSQENPDSPFVKNARAFVDINFYNPFLILSSKFVIMNQCINMLTHASVS